MDIEPARFAGSENEKPETASVIECWNLACVILGLDATMQAALLNAFLSAGEARSKCRNWWIPSTLSATFSSLTLLSLLYLLLRLYPTEIRKLLFTALLFIIVSALLVVAFPLFVC